MYIYIYIYIHIYIEVDKTAIITGLQPTMRTTYTHLKTQFTGWPVPIDSHIYSYFKSPTESYLHRLDYPTQPVCVHTTHHHIPLFNTCHTTSIPYTSIHARIVI